jgi:hypothetical protein
VCLCLPDRAQEGKQVTKQTSQQAATWRMLTMIMILMMIAEEEGQAVRSGPSVQA